MAAGYAVVFTIKRGFVYTPNFFNALATVTGTSGSTWTQQATTISRGLFIPRCLAVEGGGNIFFRVDDGIHWSRRGAASVSITDEDLYPLFVHEGSTPQPVVRNGKTYYPPDDSRPEEQQFSIQNGYLYYDYGYLASDFPFTESALFIPAAVASQGQGIAWQDPTAAMLTGVGSNQAVLIVGFSISGDVVTINTATQQDPLVEGQKVVISGLGVGTYLNGQTLTISPLSDTSFQAPFVHPDVGSTFDIGLATPTTAYAFATNASYNPPPDNYAVLAFPSGTPEGPAQTSGNCFGSGAAPWAFVAGDAYGAGVNGCPLGMTPAGWVSNPISIPSLPPGAVVTSIVPVAMGTQFGRFGSATFTVTSPAGSYTFVALDGTLHQAPSIGTTLSDLNSTTFAVSVSNTLDQAPGVSEDFGCNVSFFGVAINYTVPGTPISQTQLQVLAATNLGLAIPSASPVTGIKVNLQTGMQYGATANLVVQLTLNGVPVGSPKGLFVGPWATEYPLGGNGDTWGLEVDGSEVNGSSGLGVKVSGDLPQGAQINLNDLNGEVFYTINVTGEGTATLVYDICAKGFIFDQYDGAKPTVHAANEGESQQGTLVGCVDGTLRLMESDSPEVVTGIVLSPAMGDAGWATAYEGTFEYSADSGAVVSFVAADAGNGSYASDPIILPGTGGEITKFTTKLTPNKWKLLQVQFESTDQTLQVYLDGCVLQVKPWGSDGLYQPISIFRPSGGRGAQG